MYKALEVIALASALVSWHHFLLILDDTSAKLALLGKVQMNLTVFKLGSPSQRLRFGIGLRHRGHPRGIAQSHQPIVALLPHAAAHEWTLPLMETALGDAVIVPDRQQCQYAC